MENVKFCNGPFDYIGNRSRRQLQYDYMFLRNALLFSLIALTMFAAIYHIFKFSLGFTQNQPKRYLHEMW